MELTCKQKRFFETFGYLALPGLLEDEIDWITEEFEAVFRGRNIVHDGSQRSCIVPFIDQRERLSTLLDHPKLVGLISGVLGEDFNYLGGDGTATASTRWASFSKSRSTWMRSTRIAAACASSPARTGRTCSWAGKPARRTSP